MLANRAKLDLRSSLIGLVLAFCVAAEAGAAPPGGWLGEEALPAALQTTVGTSWAEAPLRQSITSLARSQRVAIFLDRRVDPSRTLDYVASDRFDAVLAGIAKTQGLGVSRIGSVFYFGPPEAAARLRTLSALRREEARGFAPERKEALLARRAWAWPALTTPRALLDELAAAGGIRLTGTEQVPHDLWPAVDLPPMAWTDRMTLVLVGFDLTFSVSADGQAVTIVPIPEKVTIRRTYRAGSNAAESLAARLRTEAPSAVLRVTSGGFELTARAEGHELARGILNGTVSAGPRQPKAVPPAGAQRHQLRVRNAPIAELLDKLARQLNLELDRASLAKVPEELKTRVTVELTGATLDELLTAVLNPAGLSYKRDGRRIAILRKKE